MYSKSRNRDWQHFDLELKDTMPFGPPATLLDIFDEVVPCYIPTLQIFWICRGITVCMSIVMHPFYNPTVQAVSGMVTYKYLCSIQEHTASCQGWWGFCTMQCHTVSLAFECIQTVFLTVTTTSNSTDFEDKSVRKYSHCNTSFMNSSLSVISGRSPPGYSVV